jgi:hypothetical protein
MRFPEIRLIERIRVSLNVDLLQAAPLSLAPLTRSRSTDNGITSAKATLTTLRGLSPSRLPDRSSDYEFSGQNPPTEGHVRIVETTLEKHFHTGFSDLLLVDSDRREWRVHQNGFFAVVETHQTDLLRYFHALT